jgi:hypothetical protein
LTGSTQYGSVLTNTHQFTGSVGITGSNAALLNINNGVLYVSASGNVGIGTSSPSYKLSVVGPALGNAISWTDNANNTGYLGIRGASASIGADNNLVFETAATERMRISSTGAATFSSSVTAGTTAYGANGGFIINYSTGNASSRSWRLATDQTSWGDFAIQQSTTQTGTTYNQPFNITSAGNVGIGTTTPNGGLTVVAPTSSTAISLWGRATDNYSALRFQSNTGASTYATIYSDASNLIFENGGSERMRINSSGTIVMPSNQLTPSFNAFGLILQGYSGNNTWISDNLYYANGTGWVRAATGTVTQIYFDGGKIAMYTAGSDSAGTVATRIAGPYLANGGTSWTNSSDIRKKKNFEPTQGLAEILQIEPVKYNLKTDEDGATKRLGFKAQNLQTLIPEMVMETSEKAEDGSNYLGLTHDYILPVLVKAIQELSAKNTALEEILQRNNIQ